MDEKLRDKSLKYAKTFLKRAKNDNGEEEEEDDLFRLPPDEKDKSLLAQSDEESNETVELIEDANPDQERVELPLDVKKIFDFMPNLSILIFESIESNLFNNWIRFESIE